MPGSSKRGSNDYDIIVSMGHLPEVLMKDAKDPKIMRAAMIAAIDYVEPLVQRVLWENTPVGTGLARTLLQYERPDKGAAKVTREMTGRVGYAEPAGVYMYNVEVGSYPHWTPLQPLMLWAARKFGDDLIGWYVRFNISRKGTRPQWFVKRSQEALINPVREMMIERMSEVLNSPWAFLRGLLGL